MINIVDPKQKRRLWFQLTKMSQKLEKRYAKKIGRLLNRQYIDAAKLVEQAEENFNVEIDKQNNRMKNEIAQHYRITIDQFSQLIFDQVEKAQVKGYFDEFTFRVRQWIDLHATRKIKQVNDTTKKVIRRIIKKGFTDGLSFKDIAKNIRKTGRITSKRRALTIARTETGIASAVGTREAFSSLRITAEKEWMSAMDSRTRDTHRSADGQRVPIGEPFTVGGEKLDHPKDPKGSAKNIINCRCVELYHPI